MKQIYSALIILLLCVTPAAACLWTYGTALNGAEMELEGVSLEDAVSVYLNRLGTVQPVREDLVADSLEKGRALARDGGYKARTDYAVSLIRLHHFADAVEMLYDVEREHPGEYVTATNLGTAYELLGRNDSALRWIREGLRRNPASHYGSEWLHVRILETKLALANDPAWLRSHTVTGIDFGSDPIPAMPRSAKGELGRDSIRQLGEHIFYQLGERLRFARKPDPVVADLLTDLGNTLAFTEALQIAVEVYGLALEYGPARPEPVRTRIAALRGIIGENPPSRDRDEHHWRVYGPQAGIFLGVVLAVISGAIIVFTRWRRRRANRRAAR